jgi:AP2-like factor (ANT lineage)
VQLVRGWCKREPGYTVIAAAHSLEELQDLNLGVVAGAGAHDLNLSAGIAGKCRIKWM